MIDEDVVEEHNGVYGGKWHIVSHEGFDLPEAELSEEQFVREFR